ncbi:MAG: hypothetical protein ACREJO_18000 [Phycisphaerales bacterium]
MSTPTPTVRDLILREVKRRLESLTDLVGCVVPPAAVGDQVPVLKAAVQTALGSGKCAVQLMVGHDERDGEEATQIEQWLFPVVCMVELSAVGLDLVTNPMALLEKAQEVHAAIGNLYATDAKGEWRTNESGEPLAARTENLGGGGLGFASSADGGDLGPVTESAFEVHYRHTRGNPQEAR